MSRTVSRDKLVLLVILGAAFGLRLMRLADANIWFDEGWSVYMARHSFWDIVQLTAQDTHPPLYYWLLHIWRTFAGDSEFAVRFLSVVFGTLAVAAIWYLARLLVPDRPWVAVAAALLLSISRFAIWWSQETRMFIPAALFSTLSLAFTVRLRWRPSWQAGLGYLLATIAGLWTLYLVVFALAIEGLWWLWTLRQRLASRDRRQLLLQWVALQLVVMVGWGIWLVYALPRTPSWSAQQAFDPMTYLQLYATLLSLGISTNLAGFRLPVIAVFALLVLGLVALGIRRYTLRGARPGNLALLLLALLVPPTAVWLVTMLPRSFGYIPRPEARYLLPFAPAFSLLLAFAVSALAGFAGRARYLLGIGLLIALVGLSAWSLADYYAGRYLGDDYRSVARTLTAHRQPEDAVLLQTDADWPVFAYYWPGAFTGVPNGQALDPGYVDRFLTPLWQEHDAVWLVVNEDALRMDRQRLFENWLSQRAMARNEWAFGTKRLVLFARSPQRAANLLALAAGFAPSPPAQPLSDQGLALVGWEPPLTTVRAGDIAYLAAYVARHGAGGTLAIVLGDPSWGRAEVEVPPGDGLIRVPLQVRISPDAPDSTVHWRARLGTAEADEGVERIVAMPPATLEQAHPQHPLQATFGAPASIRLLGYDVSGPATSDNSIHLTLYWQDIATPAASYKVFTHLSNLAGQVVAQHDDFPVQGSRPTTGWRSDEIIVDTYAIPIGTDVLPGTYTLAVGFYDATTGARLQPVLDAAGTPQPDGQLRLQSIDIHPGAPSP